MASTAMKPKFKLGISSASGSANTLTPTLAQTWFRISRHLCPRSEHTSFPGARSSKSLNSYHHSTIVVPTSWQRYKTIHGQGLYSSRQLHQPERHIFFPNPKNRHAKKTFKSHKASIHHLQHLPPLPSVKDSRTMPPMHTIHLGG